MEIKKENVINAYMAGDNSIKEMLRAMFPDIEFEADNVAENRPIMERVKTFEDACRELGEEHLFVKQYNSNEMADVDTDLDAYLKLRIICAALNEGWKPKFIEDEYRWFPFFYLYTQEEIDSKNDEWKQERHLIGTGGYETEYDGLVCANSVRAPSSAHTRIGSRLCLKSEALATYCGTQFIQLWADFDLIKK